MSGGVLARLVLKVSLGGDWIVGEDLDVKWKKAVVEIAREFRKSNDLKGLELEDALKRKIESLDISRAQKEALLRKLLVG